MTLAPSSRCPGSGMQMVSRTYVIRNIEPADREKNAWRIARAQERGDLEEADIIRDHFNEWEKEQGQTREQMVFPVGASATSRELQAQSSDVPFMGNSDSVA